jgi:hypothetical protein
MPADRPAWIADAPSDRLRGLREGAADVVVRQGVDRATACSICEKGAAAIDKLTVGDKRWLGSLRAEAALGESVKALSMAGNRTFRTTSRALEVGIAELADKAAKPGGDLHKVVTFLLTNEVA